MKFEEALIELRKGKKIKRKAHENYISYKSPIETEVILIDILNDLDDWEVYEEPGKSFTEVFEALKSGKFIKRKEWIDGISCKEEGYLSITNLLCTDWEIIE